jgi:predicted amidohydrolase YtcJ
MRRRDFFGLAAGAGVLGGLPAWAQQNASPDTSFDPSMWVDDMAIVNAKVITMNPAQPAAQAVLVHRGRIVAVGTNAQIRDRARGAKVFDAGGRTVVPGFVDTHIHIEWSAAATALMVNMWGDQPKTIAEVLARLRAKADQTPAGKWILAEGPISSSTQEKRLPTIQELDSVSERHPIAVFNGVHTNVGNSLAAKAMGYLTYEDEAQARWWSNGQPYTGGTVERDEHGHAGPAHDFVMRLPKDLWSVEELKGAIRKTAKEMFIAGGVTSASPVCLVSSNEYSADQQLQAVGELPMRLRAYYMAPFSVGVDQVLDTGVTRGFGNDMFRTGGFKLIYDGGRHNGRQTHHYTQDEYADLITKIHARGLQAITHCVSEEGAAQVVGGIEEVRKRFANGPMIYHRIEHWRPQAPELMARMKAASMYYTSIASQGRRDTDYGPRQANPYGTTGGAYRSLIASGVHPIPVSDKCGGNPTQPRPMNSLAAMCNPMSKGGDAVDGEEVGFDDALRMWTLWAAQSTHQDHDRGSIQPGKLGDFAVLNGDPRSLQPADYFKLKVDTTILGGRVVYGA